MMRVLVVDDEPLARGGVRARLAAHADMQLVGEAADGVAAIKSIESLRPDLVFMDVQMPGLDGLAALRHLPPAERPLSILLTAYDHFAVGAFEIQALDYLLKPIDDERFREKAREKWRELIHTVPVRIPAATSWARSVFLLHTPPPRP